MQYANLDLEKTFWLKGLSLICGADEVGRGCFAGPVVVGAVVFSPGCLIPKGIADSKLLKSNVRSKLDSKIKEQSVCWSIAEVSVSVINQFGIGKATQMAFRKAIKNLKVNPDHILVDAFYVKHINKKRQTPIKKGDRLSISIAAASIIAKVYRDDLMRKMNNKFPQYGFDKNKGYGTKFHQRAIAKYGLSRIHRKSFNLAKFMI